jgi:hypothetical protein
MVRQRGERKSTEVCKELRENTLVSEQAMVNSLQRKSAGRPKAIPEDMIWTVITFYQQGLGYRAIARELAHQGVDVDWSTVRRVIKKWLSEKGNHNGLDSNSNTILQRGGLEE